MQRECSQPRVGCSTAYAAQVQVTKQQLLGHAGRSCPGAGLFAKRESAMGAVVRTPSLPA